MNGKEGLKKAVVLFCVIYTITTVLNSVWYLAQGVYEDPSGNWHELTRSVVVLIGTLAYSMACYLPIKNSLLKSIVIYLPTMGLTFFFVFLNGFVEPLSKNAYRDIFFNYTLWFVIIFVVATLIGKFRTRKNRE